MDQVLDLILLTHNRLAHLVATVDALEERTRSPYRLTIVDNASGPEVRNWLAANRARFHGLVLLAENEFLPALNHAIPETTSDPFIVTDPDLIVPEPDGDRCWLTQMRELMERHPDFGLIGIGLDQSNLPPVQEPEAIDPSEIVDGEIVERGVGSLFTLIRRDALQGPYVNDYQTCLSVMRAGYRRGWTLNIRAYHLGWDDFKLYPGHLASKLVHGEYREVNLIERAPTLPELAVAGPVSRVTRDAGIPDAAVLELAWNGPAVAAGLPDALAVERPQPGPLPLGEGAAGAVVLVDPPVADAAGALAEACRIASHLVVAVAPLEAFASRTAGELAPAGWSGREAAGPSDLALALAERSVSDEALAAQVGVRTLDDREQWLAMFATSAFGSGRRRLWIFERTAPLEMPERVLYDPARLTPWARVAVAPPRPRRRLAEKVRTRSATILRVTRETARIRAARLKRAA